MNSREQLIDRKMHVDRKISEINAFLLHHKEDEIERGIQRYTPYQRRLMREELADLKVESQRLQHLLSKIKNAEKAKRAEFEQERNNFALYWFRTVAKEELPEGQYQRLWDLANARMQDHIRSNNRSMAI